MKFSKKIMSLMLALVMIFGLTVNVSAATTQNIKVQLSPNITVKYNGEIQSMTDVNGTPVYPLLNGGTTYLPVRAVSNMLGVDVDWDGATQTVILTDPAGGRKPGTSTTSTSTKPAPSMITVQLSPNITVKYNGKAQAMTDVNGNPVYPILNGGTTYLPVRAVSNMLGVGVDWDGTTQTVLLNSENNANNAIDDDAVESIRQLMKHLGYPDSFIEAAIAEFKATGTNNNENTNIIDDVPTTCDYAEVDDSTANDGYVQVKLTKQVAKVVDCYVEWPNSGNSARNHYTLKLGQWVKIPLLGGSNKYLLTIKCNYSTDEESSMTDYELYVQKHYVEIPITASIENPNAWTLMSHAGIDFENAPKAVAKAAELTKNCKTDAEKITAIFEFVAKTIKYDNNLIPSEQKRVSAGESPSVVYGERNYDLDNILTSKTGVCEHYAVLMAGMLRSFGIPCKVVEGDAYDGREWASHAWVSVSPDTKGFNMQRLGAGHDEDGWIRLDPTWASTGGTYGRSQAAIDKNHKTLYAH